MLKHHATRFFLLIVLASSTLTGCQLGQVSPSEDQVWNAYIQAPQATHMLPRTEYAIVFIGRNGTIVGSTTNSAKCFPDALKTNSTSLEGTQYVYEIRTKVDNAIQANIEFTKWEGIDSWWIWVSDSCFEYRE